MPFICSSVRDRGLPGDFPLARAAAIPLCVLSLIRSRSNSANAPNRWNTSFPIGFDVSICSVIDINPIPFFSNVSVTSAIKSLRDLLSLSSLQTTTVSPVRIKDSNSCKLARSMFLPDAVSE